MMKIREFKFIAQLFAILVVVVSCNVAEQTDVNTSRSTSSTTVATETFKYNVESVEFVQNTSDVQIFPTTTYTGYYFRVLPTLPTGLRLNTSTGTISGTPTGTQSASEYLIEAQDLDGNTEYAIIELSVIAEPPKSIKYDYTTLTFTKDTYDLYSATTTGGNISFLSVTPSLPSGLSLDTNGDIYGTPLVSTSGNYIVSIENDSGSASVKIAIKIDDIAPTGLTYPSNDGQTVPIGTTMTTMVPGTLTSSPDSVAYSVIPTLPPGVTINSETGEISGTPTAATGITSYRVYVTNGAGSTYDDISLTVTNPATALSYAVTTISAEQGVPIDNITLQSYTGGKPVTFACISCPTGISVNASTGTISGTPTDPLNSYPFSVSATDTATSTTITTALTLQLSEDAPSDSSYLGYQNHYTLYKDKSFSFTPNIIGGMPTTWSIDKVLSTEIPGLSFNADGSITGTPTVATASTTFTVTGENLMYDGSNSETGHQTFTIEVKVLAPTKLAYGASSEYDSTDKVYKLSDNVTIDPIIPTVTGGVPDSYRVLPTLPTGLSLDTTTGYITGAPTVSTPIRYYTITAENVSGSTSQTIAISTSIIIGPSNLTYIDPAAATIFTGSIDVSPATYNGSSAVFSISPALPLGLTIDSSSGRIYGTPLAGDGGSYTITATNAAGSTTNSTPLTILINNVDPAGLVYEDASGNNSMSFTDGDIIDNTDIIHYSSYDGANTSVGNITSYSETGANLTTAGLTLDTSTGDITGTATPTTPRDLSPPALSITINGTNNSLTSVPETFTLNVVEVTPDITYKTSSSSLITSENTIFIAGSGQNTSGLAPVVAYDLITATNAGGLIALTDSGGTLTGSACDAEPKETPVNATFDIAADPLYGGGVDNIASTANTAPSSGNTPSYLFHFDATTCNFRYHRNGCFGSGETIEYTLTAQNSGGTFTTDITVHTYDIPNYTINPDTDTSLFFDGGKNIVLNGAKTGDTINSVSIDTYLPTLDTCHNGSFSLSPSANFPSPFTLDTSTAEFASGGNNLLAKQVYSLEATELDSGFHKTQSESITFQSDHIEDNGGDQAYRLRPIISDIDGDGYDDILIQNTLCEDYNGDNTADKGSACSSEASSSIYLQSTAFEGHFVGATGSAFPNFTNLDASAIQVMPYTSSKTAILYTQGSNIYAASIHDALASGSDAIVTATGFPRGIITHNVSTSTSFGVVIHNRSAGVAIDQYQITGTDLSTLNATTTVSVQNYASGGISLANTGTPISVVDSTDINDDGYNDIALGYRDSTDSRTRVCIIMNSGTNFNDTCTARITLPPTEATAIVTDIQFVDIAGDDLEDMVVLVKTSSRNYVYIYENKYNTVAGLYQQIDSLTLKTISDTSKNFVRMDMADVDQDGNIDIIVNDVEGNIDSTGTASDDIITGFTVYLNSGSESDLFSSTNYNRNEDVFFYSTSTGDVNEIKAIQVGSHLQLLHCQMDINTTNSSSNTTSEGDALTNYTFSSCGIAHQFY